MDSIRDKSIRWLRISFIVGAIFDAILGVMILIPGRMGETEFRYPMGLAATLMFGWTCLLLWGYQKPVERRFVLILTIFPVITGLMASSVYQFISGVFGFTRVLPFLILGTALIVLFGISYWKTRQE